MPVPVKKVCKRCKGETLGGFELCACCRTDHFKTKYGHKHLNKELVNKYLLKEYEEWSNNNNHDNHQQDDQ